MADALKRINSRRVPVMIIQLAMKVLIPSRTVVEVIPGGNNRTEVHRSSRLRRKP